MSTSSAKSERRWQAEKFSILIGSFLSKREPDGSHLKMMTVGNPEYACNLGETIEKISFSDRAASFASLKLQLSED